MRLFKRKGPLTDLEPCPRCSQLVGGADGSTCPMCGWDLHEAYQGPTRTAGDEATETPGDAEERFRRASHDAPR